MKIVHKVSAGDTLEKIADKYNVNLNELVKINDLTSLSLDNINLIVIPQNESDFVVVKNLDKEFLYEVKKENSEILKKILKNKLIIADTSSNSNYEDGDKIIFKNSEYKKYTVRPLDNLNMIAKNFGVSTDYLIKINNLKTNKVFIGQQLIV